MNDSPLSAPIAAPDDARALPKSSGGAHFCHFMQFWLIGQGIFTIFQLIFAALTHGKSDAMTWAGRELMLSWLPLAFGMGALIFGYFRALPLWGNLSLGLSLVVISVALGVVNLFILAVTALTGFSYC